MRACQAGASDSIGVSVDDCLGYDVPVAQRMPVAARIEPLSSRRRYLSARDGEYDFVPRAHPGGVLGRRLPFAGGDSQRRDLSRHLRRGTRQGERGEF